MADATGPEGKRAKTPGAEDALRRPSVPQSVPGNPKLFSKTIHKFVLTGGPCAGKTSSLARVSNFLRTRGFRVFLVPEAATMIFQGGWSVNDLGKEANRVAFQTALCKTQIGLEDTFYQLAEMCDEPAVLLCDRGCMDGSAYIAPGEWDQMLDNIGQSNVDLRDGRYNAILHLVTAADGKAEFYTTVNNVTRTETPEMACEVDVKLRKAWVGHSNHHVIDNSTLFEEKMGRVVNTVAKLVGLPSSVKRFSKFLVKPSNSPLKLPADVTVQEFMVEKVYIKSQNPTDDTVHFARKRHPMYSPEMNVYGITTVATHEDGTKLETKRIIKRSDYQWLIETQRDPTRVVVRQRRVCFLMTAEQQYYEIHEYLEPDTHPETQQGTTILHVQRVADQPPVIPPFIDVLKEVTDDPKYSAQFLSTIKIAEPDE